MSATNEDRPLKVCSTCGYWTPKYKGFCLRLQQGAGKFFMCEGWSTTAEETEDVLLAGAKEAAGASKR